MDSLVGKNPKTEVENLQAYATTRLFSSTPLKGPGREGAVLRNRAHGRTRRRLANRANRQSDSHLEKVAGVLTRGFARAAAHLLGGTDLLTAVGAGTLFTVLG